VIQFWTKIRKAAEEDDSFSFIYESITSGFTNDRKKVPDNRLVSYGARIVVPSAIKKTSSLMIV